MEVNVKQPATLGRLATMMTITMLCAAPAADDSTPITIWPMDNSGRDMSLARGIVTMVNVKFRSPSPWKDAVAAVDVPPAITVFGRRLQVQPDPVTLGDCPLKRYTVTTPELILGLMPEPTAPDNVTLRFSVLTGNDPARTVVERVVQAHVFPEPTCRAGPERFRIWLWRSGHLARAFFGNMPLFEALARSYRAIGISLTVDDLIYRMNRDRLRTFIDASRANGMRFYSVHCFDGCENAMSPYLAPKGHRPLPAEACQLNFGGARLTTQFCPGYVVQTGQELFTRYPLILARDREAIAAGADGILFDLELGWGGSAMKVCYCPRCLQAFAEFAGIPVADLSVAAVFEHHRHAWLRFRARQIAEAMRLFGEAWKGIDPDTEYYLVDHGLTTEVSRPWQEVRWLDTIGASDPRLMDPFVDVHGPMWYTDSRSVYRYFELNRPALTKPLLPLVDISQYWGKRAKKPAHFRLDLLSAASAGADGVTIYHSTGLDGEYYHCIDTARREIAVLERYFTTGRRRDGAVQVQGIDHSLEWEKVGDVQWKVHELDGELLVSLFNLNFSAGREAYVKVSFPALAPGRYSVVEPARDTLHLPADRTAYWNGHHLGRGMFLKIGVEDARFLRVGPFREGRTHAVVQYEERPDPARTGGGSCCVRDLPAADCRTLELCSPFLRVGIVPAEGGRIAYLLSPVTGRVHMPRTGSGLEDVIGGCGRAEVYPGEFLILSYDAAVVEQPDWAEVMVSARKDYVWLERRMRVFRDVPRMTVRVTCRNVGRGIQPFQIRIHPALNVGAGDPKADSVFIPSGDQVLDVVFHSGKQYEPDGGWWAAFAPETGDCLVAVHDPAQVAALYPWGIKRYNGPYCLEYFGKTEELAPGGTVEMAFDYWLVSSAADIDRLEHNETRLDDEHRKRLVGFLRELYAPEK